MESKEKQDCAVCYQIICKRCGWVASDEAVLQIQRSELTACPDCGWKPGDTL